MKRDAWREMSPAQVLDAYPALTLEQLAYVLNLTRVRGGRKGEPDPRRARRLIDESPRRLFPVDGSQPAVRWRVSADVVRRYLADPVG